MAKFLFPILILYMTRIGLGLIKPISVSIYRTLRKHGFPNLLIVGIIGCPSLISLTPEQIPLSDGFDFPVGPKKGIKESRNGDGWYNANDFGEDRHLGEDWNGEKGGNTDCGEPVYAASNGLVVYSANAGPGWGNIIIIRHQLPDGRLLETQYAHLKDRLVEKKDTVTRRDLIGHVGDGRTPCGDSKPYYAHLHFEMRLPDCRAWGDIGPGYSNNLEGWIDPSDFINSNRKFDD